jgi:hypothetical protein
VDAEWEGFFHGRVLEVDASIELHQLYSCFSEDLLKADYATTATAFVKRMTALCHRDITPLVMLDNPYDAYPPKAAETAARKLRRAEALVAADASSRRAGPPTSARSC